MINLEGKQAAQMGGRLSSASYALHLQSLPDGPTQGTPQPPDSSPERQPTRANGIQTATCPSGTKRKHCPLVEDSCGYTTLTYCAYMYVHRHCLDRRNHSIECCAECKSVRGSRRLSAVVSVGFLAFQLGRVRPGALLPSSPSLAFSLSSYYVYRVRTPHKSSGSDVAGSRLTRPGSKPHVPSC